MGETSNAAVRRMSEALNEVRTNGEWRDGQWCIDREVYEMVEEALDARLAERLSRIERRRVYGRKLIEFPA